ncbi:NUDIX hydrolase [Mesoplasma corruscae]|uniref:Nucleoside diphosphate hydrolase n=1 Tax=Mesoplasma corruscae TaxID=216874 RepID=A0A2S5RH59_9MOLU|nr:NUDIX domain-containing protein [Mesoplasma corruscae]PPE06627.1 nucleoside diphosphate hydrolase [Mesoplasma corruscae]
MEILDLYDCNKIKTGKTMIRGEKVPNGYYRLVVKIAIFNSRNEMLIQRINKSPSYPSIFKWFDKWDISVSGSATTGDNSWQAAQREVKEELGLIISFENQVPKMSFTWSDGFIDIYIKENFDVDLKTLTLQPEEVAEVKWASKEQVLNLISKKEFVAWKPEIIELLFKRDSKDGTLNIKK